MNPKVKIALIVAVVIAVIVAVYFLLRKPKVASSEAIAKAKSGNYGTWGEGASPDWGAYLAKSQQLFSTGGTSLGVEGGNNQAYASGFLKGLNVQRSAAGLSAFEADIKAYISSTNKKPDWQVTTGQYL
jgi:hypothetical protein